MTKWGLFFAAAALSVLPASAATLRYELTLAADTPYTAFGGGPAGDTFVGVFGFDDALVGSPGAVFDPALSANAFFLHININGTTFSTATPGILADNGLRFMGGPLLDVFFDLTNPNGDRLEVRTDFLNTSIFTVTQGIDLDTIEGSTFSTSVSFLPIPEPSGTALATLGTLLLLRRRR